MRRIERSAARADEHREAARSIHVNNPVIAGRDAWQKDSSLDAFKTSNLDAKFACNCGAEFSPNGMHRCACGQTWNSFVISPNEKQASQSLRIVRPVPEFRERVLASKSKKKMAGWVKSAVETAGIPSFVRSANESNGGDVAPTVFEKQAADNMGDTPPAMNDQSGTTPVDRAGDVSGPEMDITSPATASPGSMAAPLGTPEQPGSPAQTDLTGTGPTTMPQTAPAQANPMANMINPMGTPPRQTAVAGSGWGNGNAGAASQPAGKPVAQPAPKAKPKPPAQTQATPPPAQTPVQWGPKPQVAPAQPAVQPAATAVAPAVAPVVQQQQIPPIMPQVAGQPGVLQPGQIAPAQPIQQARTYNMTFSEDDYRMGWALASSDAPLPARALHSSLIEGYRDFYREVVADNAPGWDTVAPLFEKPDEKKNNSMSDYTDTKEKNLSQEYKEVRNDLKNKIDSDNAKGQSRSDDSMADFSGWKNKTTSALLEELQRRLTGE